MEKKMDLRIQKTYLALHNAFTEILEEKHFEDFTVNELCDRAMIRRTTFYKHFADKYDYYTFYIKEICEEIRKEFASDIPSNEINTYFFEMIRGLIHFMKTRKKLVDNIMKSNMFSLLFDMLIDLVRAEVYFAMRKIENTPAIFAGDLEGAAAFYAGGLLSTLRYYYERDSLADEEKVIQTISNFMPNMK